MLNKNNNIFKLGLALFAGVLFSFNVSAQSIYDIQFTESSMGTSPYADQDVSTSGVVTATFDFGYWIQDGSGPWTGLYVFDSSNTPSIGDAISVSGTIEEYFDLTELLDITSYSMDSVGVVPPATVLSTTDVGAEMYEGVLVRVELAECTDADVGSNFGQWTVNDGSGNVFIDDQIFPYAPVQGEIYNVTGVCSYSFEEWKIEPRDANDIEVFVGINETPTIQWRTYPNPVSNDLVVEASSDNFQLEIISMDGRVVANQQYNQRTARVDFSSLAKGMYLVQITDGTLTESKLIEKN